VTSEVQQTGRFAPHPDPLSLKLAIVAPTQAPYRLAFHRRIVRELPSVQLHSIYTHRQGLSPWAYRDDAETNCIDFSGGDDAALRSDPRHALRNLSRGGRIIRYLDDHAIDAVMVVGYNDPGMLRIIRHNARIGRPQFLWGDSNAAADHARHLKLAVKRRLVGWVLSKCDAVLVCGTLGAEFFTRYGADPRRIFRCPIEPDYSLIEEIGEPDLRKIRERFGLRADRRRFVFCGRLVGRKRADLVIDAFNRAAPRLPDWDLVMVGDGPLRAELEARVDPSLRDRVVWTGFLDDQPAISAIYRASHVLLHPCDFEPWGLIILEAAAAGMGIITTSACGAGRELVRPDRNGALLEPGDLVGLARAMTSCGDAGVCAQWQRESRAALADFRRGSDSVRGLREALDACLASRPRPASATR